ncbi:lytic transglycosylase domain-containing protein [Burkholderia vietnamiensis]|uniref:lytic transglycosylase domain-containing protein n=1 Tax=Burkholderia vietnamiensis TaxID=60552 RepID=UPI000753AD03|nr:lytic transglycosylase domain-containing protein [Burkholderia vietnamiensis]AOK42593.1 lytic transglycosylase [Burkholderia vietnamiensis]KVE15967.1 lytic transglycosylase [Burkholderia vietnamiensis]KVR82588.1 lytic transglycosylase [Burkholderia vietnamiensis]KVR89955.1 lytic transglycosylase [Burkholderia vietnamiensis]KVR93231.1 lytic transglycosylase [Burkholderia vietnamiensis]
MRLLRLFVALAAAGAAHSSYADCLDDAATYQHINPKLVRAIAQYESQMRPSAVNRNANGSEDIGLMQINSAWLPKLAQYGIRREHLFNACVNAYVGAWILAANIRQFGPNWKAVGAYNATTPSKQLVYASAIYRRLMQQGY